MSTEQLKTNSTEKETEPFYVAKKVYCRVCGVSLGTACDDDEALYLGASAFACRWRFELVMCVSRYFGWRRLPYAQAACRSH